MRLDMHVSVNFFEDAFHFVLFISGLNWRELSTCILWWSVEPVSLYGVSQVSDPFTDHPYDILFCFSPLLINFIEMSFLCMPININK